MDVVAGSPTVIQGCENECPRCYEIMLWIW